MLRKYADNKILGIFIQIVLTLKYLFYYYKITLYTLIHMINIIIINIIY